MKQVFQSLSNGETQLLDIPSPNLCSTEILVRTRISLLSSGTERILVEFGKSNLINKARKQPDKVKEVIDKTITDGLFSTLDAVRSKLAQPIPLGYSNVGEVIGVGEKVKGFNIGDRVLTNGPHAEIFSVSKNLSALIPNDVSDEAASFTVLSSIGLQGIRLAAPTLGETFLVSGLGLIGLLTAQLLKSHGCIVLGIDPDPNQCKIAESLGIDTLLLSDGVEPISWCLSKTSGIGVDGVVVTASTTSSEPIHMAAQACRQRGRIILVGVTGLELRRDLFYKKELTFQVSCSYGPGRYDDEYEKKGNDYPIGFVRWTEQRNFKAILELLQAGKIKTDCLISHHFPIERAEEAYELLTSNEKSLGILLTFSPKSNIQENKISLKEEQNFYKTDKNQAIINVIGAGNYASRTLIPAFKKAGAKFRTIGASSGIRSFFLAKKFDFNLVTTNYKDILEDDLSNSIVIATRHDSHSEFIIKSLENGKNVFVEKPLCLTLNELNQIETLYKNKFNEAISLRKNPPILMVGFNRRFSPLVLELKKYLKNITSPKAFIYTCNAGAIPSNHWIHDPNIGGGRLIGEGCHFVDLIRYLVNSPISKLSVEFISDDCNLLDNFVIQLSFDDGSLGTVNYFSNGSKSFPKERLEVFADGQIFQLDNFRKLKSWGRKSIKTKKTFFQDKGQQNCAKAFLNSISNGGLSPIPIEEIVEVQSFILKAIL